MRCENGQARWCASSAPGFLKDLILRHLTHPLFLARFDLNAGNRLATADPSRSEEHTSELQSLMRISYAVFCLKKKNPTHHTTTVYNPSHTYYNSIHTTSQLQF